MRFVRYDDDGSIDWGVLRDGAIYRPSAFREGEPGLDDVVSTGTPGGVGVFRDPPELLEPGDTVEVEVEEVGTLRNPVVAAE